MKIGLIKPTKGSEQRIMLVPSAVKRLTKNGHEVFIESDAGVASNFEDTAYESAGAQVLPTSEKVFKHVELVLKVQPPMPIEYELYSPDHIGLSFLNLSKSRDLLTALVKTKATFIAAEMLPSIQAAMGDINGKMAVFQAAHYLQKENGGKGILISGSSIIPPAQFTIIGSAITGIAAARQALAVGAHVNLVGGNYDRLLAIKKEEKNDNLNIFEFSRGILKELLLESDVLITAIDSNYPIQAHIPKEDIGLLKAGSVVIDVSPSIQENIEMGIDRSSDKPVVIQDGLIFLLNRHPSSLVPYTASSVLSAAAATMIEQIASVGFEEAVAVSSEIRQGLNIFRGRVVHPALSSNDQFEVFDILELLELNI